ncbi:NXPE family member 3-like [Pelobates fuscus]|uniref:NXPE family member 3-like n=1 Tax=Pelobates fuscus TaxID=191477 RepID=UPI002FE49EA6
MEMSSHGSEGGVERLGKINESPSNSEMSTRIGFYETYQVPQPRTFLAWSNSSSDDNLNQQQINTAFVNLLSLIQWPDIPLKELQYCNSTSPKQSQYHIVNKRVKYKVGETLEVLIMAKDHMARPKTYGGDFFQVKLHSPKLKAGVTGHVKDYRNGSYLATFLLPWPGKAQVNIRLIHSSEAVSVLKDKREKHPDKVFFHGHFQSNGVSEVKECNLKVSGENICEYKDPVTEEIWQCVKPQKLPCDSWIYHSMGGYRQVTNAVENALLSRSVTNKNIPSTESSINIEPQSTIDLTSSLSVCKTGQEPTQPSGYYYKDQWTSLVCMGRHFPQPDDARACLRGKDIYMFGDSTLRQWFEYLENFIPSLKRIDLHLNYQSGPLLAVDADYGIVMRWRAHGLPLRTTKTLTSNLHYEAAYIYGIGGGPYTVVVITLWAHFTTYPIAVYLQRLARVQKAVASLLFRSPQTTILIKSANTGYKSIYGSDWLSLQLDILMRAAFKGMAVTVLDAWDMTSCHYLPDTIHPGPPIVRNEVDLMLSYICPK